MTHNTENKMETFNKLYRDLLNYLQNFRIKKVLLFVYVSCLCVKCPSVLLIGVCVSMILVHYVSVFNIYHKYHYLYVLSKFNYKTVLWLTRVGGNYFAQLQLLLQLPVVNYKYIYYIYIFIHVASNNLDN